MTAATLPLAEHSHAKLDKLGDFLEQRCLPNGGMEISTLDGFLTALASSPEQAPAREWLPLVFGSQETEAEIEGFRDQVLRRFVDVGDMLEAGRLSPIFIYGHESEEDDERPDAPYVAFADLWCIGYLHGIALRDDAWRPLTHGTEEDRFLLAPIFALTGSILEAGGVGRDAEVTAALRDRERRDIGRYVPSAAQQIYHYWQNAPLTPVRRTPQPGRNEACPCASGKKYKKCCGA
jgi:uncharacterized protein